MTADGKLGVGVLSFAHVHAPGFAACLAAMPDVSLVAIADDDEARGRAAAGRFGGEFSRDFRALLAREDVAAVVVASETARHRELIEAAAEAGKHVLTDKPIATTREDALAIIEVCRARGVKLQIAYPMRFSPPAIELRRRLREGAIGTPLAVVATNPGRMPPGWFSDPALAGGGAVMDHTVHVVDLLRWIFAEEVVRVYAEVDTRFHPGLATDDAAILMLRLGNGLPVSLDPSWSRPKTWPIWGGLTMEVIGDEGVLSMDAFRQNVELIADRGPRHELVPWGDGGDPALVRAFVDAVRNDTPPPITGEDGLKALEVALCAYESARRREPVACPDVLLG